MKRYIKRTTKQYIVVSVLSAFIIGSAFIVLYFTILKITKEKYLAQIELLQEQLESKEVYVFEAKEFIPAGSIITKDHLKYVQSYSNQTQEYFMTKEDIGMTSLIQIEPGTQILKDMLTENNVNQNLREVEYSIFHINSNIKENESIDVRILLPNGEDYIVLSKKSVKQVDPQTNHCFLWLTEEEILNMSSAVVDAFLYPGSKLYTTKYIEPNLQGPSIPTYQPSLATLNLMEKNENIVELASTTMKEQLRKELEQRLGEELIYNTNNSNYNPNETFYEEDGEVIIEYGG